nr:hypothetical protein [bacterium]
VQALVSERLEQVKHQREHLAEIEALLESALGSCEQSGSDGCPVLQQLQEAVSRNLPQSA